VMARFSPTEAAFEGFRLTREHPRAVLVWAFAYFIFTMALAILTVAWVGKDFAALQALSRDVNPDPVEMARAFEKLAPFLLVVIPLQVASFAVLNCAIYRSVLRPAESGLAYFRLGQDEMRMVALFIILFLLWLAALFIVTIAVTLAAGTLGVFGGGVGAFMGSLVDIGVFSVAIWVFVRLSMAAPMTFDQGRLVVFGSWDFTRGSFWPLLGAYVLTVLLGVVIVVLMLVISGAVIEASFLATGGSISKITHDVQSDISSVGAFLTLPTILSQAFGSAMIIIYFVIVLSPAAIAYQGLAGHTPKALESVV
jgi:hypothetical protein